MSIAPWRRGEGAGSFLRAPRLAVTGPLAVLLIVLVGRGAASADDLVDEARAAYLAGRYRTAAELADRAAEREADAGEALVVAALAREKLGDREGARARLEAVLRRPLDPARRARVSDHLARLDDEAEESALSHRLHVALGGGFDSNVRVVPLADEATAGGEPRAGAFASLALFAAVGARVGAASTELEYGLLQTAYPDRRLDGSSFQMHLGEWSWELSLGGGVRLRAPIRGDVALLGLAGGPRPFEWSAGGEPELAWTAEPGLRLRVAGGFAEHHALDPQYAFLEGAEWRGTAALDLGRTGWTMSLAARLRDESYGATRGEAAPVADDCPTCTGVVVTPYSYRAPGLALRAGAPYRWVARPSVAATFEDRNYQAPLYETNGPDGTRVDLALEARRDRRLTARAALALKLGGVWELVAAYDYVSNGSNRPEHSYRKQAIGLTLEADWL